MIVPPLMNPNCIYEATVQQFINYLLEKGQINGYDKDEIYIYNNDNVKVQIDLDDGFTSMEKTFYVDGKYLPINTYSEFFINYGYEQVD
uniref:Uncharacterized protein n=1 Tax=viral metagenome TaxID=1070528 RepID=A0A6C0J6R1_9ZZZZ